MREWLMVLCLGWLAGCATARTAAAPVDVTGRWSGTWSGAGIFLVPRDEAVTLDLVQLGAQGTGRLVLNGTLAAPSVPDAVRDSGQTGVRVIFNVSGRHVRLWHELGGEFFEADLVVLDDRMVGRARHTDPVVRFELTRERVSTAAVEAPRAGERAVTAPPPTPEPPPPAAEATAPPSRRDAPPPAEFGAVAEVRTIHFDFDRADIRPGDAAILDDNGAWLRAHPERLVLIEGHCDERGTAEYNLALGERRALATKAYLIGRGIADARMTVTSYGVERPVCTEHTEACWAQNRRASFLVK